MYRIRWRNLATAALEDIAAYIAEDNYYAAMRMVGKIRSATDNMIAFMPWMFPADDNRPDLRICTLARPYLIYCRILEDEYTIEIIDIIHAARGSKR
ncbi:type II toxin-antitoxin system RelE/ParE family toxin [uncultured Cardiobacterium sp.]|uniref:type II toxin-antitoxin system RelE/ParE family toxin n=1 Tax=uncultured Cardiobacterium sp. TaxID=417619 RepID=UPI002610E3D1|nr:type II toxin-antitoxin system RelE/ParE family toxin [uncultured Cardiobacterium sp.]